MIYSKPLKVIAAIALLGGTVVATYEAHSSNMSVAATEDGSNALESELLAEEEKAFKWLLHDATIEDLLLQKDTLEIEYVALTHPEFAKKFASGDVEVVSSPDGRMRSYDSKLMIMEAVQRGNDDVYRRAILSPELHPDAHLMRRQLRWIYEVIREHEA